MESREDNIDPNGFSAAELDDLEALIGGTEGEAEAHPPGRPPSPKIRELTSDEPSIPVPPAPPPAREVTNKFRRRRPPRKRELVQLVEEMREQNPDMVPSKSVVNSMRVAELKELLDTLEDAAEEPPPPAEIPVSSPGTSQPTQGIAMDKLMFFTLVNLASVVENLSRQSSPYTGLVLEGAAAQMREDEDDLKPLLAGVYLEHQKTIAPIMTPSTILMTYLAKVGSENVRAADPKKASKPSSSVPQPPPRKGQSTVVHSGSVSPSAPPSS